MRNLIITRLLDVAPLAILVGPYQGLKTFAAALVWIMVGLMLMGALAMSDRLALKIAGCGKAHYAFGLAVHGLYIAALIYAGYPVLAAIYAAVMALIRVAAHMKLKPQEAH